MYPALFPPVHYDHFQRFIVEWLILGFICTLTYFKTKYIKCFIYNLLHSFKWFIYHLLHSYPLWIKKEHRRYQERLSLTDVEKTEKHQMKWESVYNVLDTVMAIYLSILAWRITWTEEPDGPQSIVFQRVRHYWSDWSHMHRHYIPDRINLQFPLFQFNYEQIESHKRYVSKAFSSSVAMFLFYIRLRWRGKKVKRQKF